MCRMAGYHSAIRQAWIRQWAAGKHYNFSTEYDTLAPGRVPLWLYDSVSAALVTRDIGPLL